MNTFRRSAASPVIGKRSTRSKPILSRYETAETGEIIIDVAASRVQDLYNDFDRNAPYVKRDLDQDLVDYLLDCAGEIGRRPYLIRISLAEKPSGDVRRRVRQSIRNYFRYLGDLERRKMRRTRTTSLVLLAVGLAFFAGVTALDRLIAPRVEVLGGLLIEGLTVAAWVALWEALATFLIEWPPFRRRLRLYEGLADAEARMTVTPAAGKAQDDAASAIDGRSHQV